MAWHPLVDHCADVAACAEQLLATGLGARLARLAGQPALPPAWQARLAVLAFLHDLGKASRPFQAQARLAGSPRAGHSAAGVELIAGPLREQLNRLLGCQLEAWGPGAPHLLYAAICHHGRPVKRPPMPGAWRAADDIDPAEGVAELAVAARRWWPLAFEDGGPPLPDATALAHAFAGLVMAADWLGSDRATFAYTEPGEPDRLASARARAAKRFARMGLEPVVPRRSLLDRRPDFAKTTGKAAPNAMQADLEAHTSGVGAVRVLEAATGTGKTEAAFRLFLDLFGQGLVDGLYFALPTRAAANQIYRRVAAMVQAAFGPAAPPVVLAVPGYCRADGADGIALPDWRVLWPDDPGDATRERRWAAEHPKRYMAAPILVGTIDQALFAALPVAHAHLRGALLLRHLLVVDEVHASDAYMTELLAELLDRHRAAGGQALLMSATLGSAARAKLLLGRAAKLPGAAEAAGLPFPSLTWAEAGVERRQCLSDPTTPRRIALSLVREGEPTAAAAVADRALAIARGGARVLVIRNTVRLAVATLRALLDTVGEDDPILFRCGGVATLHHARFAREDRERLDSRIERVLGPDSPDSGQVVIATQTAEQSLDIDADFLLTDLAPMDVLLQRFGRLHRHRRPRRPEGFGQPRAAVLTPAARDLTRLFARSVSGWGRVYADFRVLEATWRALEAAPSIAIPSDNRRLVEAATHPDVLTAIGESDDRWRQHQMAMIGKFSAQSGAARVQRLSWSERFGDDPFPDGLEGRVSTRLGAASRIVLLPEPCPGPFGEPVALLPVPPQVADDVPADAEPTEIRPVPGGIDFVLGPVRMRYDRFGVGTAH